MSRIVSRLVSFFKDEAGPTAVEYAVMLALIVIVCIAAITTLGSNAEGTYDAVTEALGGEHEH
jgi:pilus assembly protein Flp/PilA